MKIVISPAKKMSKEDFSSFNTNEVSFSKETEYLVSFLSSLSKEEIKEFFNINDKLVEDTYNYYRLFMLRKDKIPALFAYEGIQYKYMGNKLFNEEELVYLNSNLRIISSLYGVLSPFDGIKPYRLEMQTVFKNKEIDNLYSFWGDKIYNNICYEEEEIINLASEEYAKCLKFYNKDKKRRIIDILFYEEEKGKLVEKGVYVKMARGAMVRYLAQNKVSIIEDITKFDELGYKYQEELSGYERIVFTRKVRK